MSPHTKHVKPLLPEYPDIFLPEYKDIEKASYPSGAFDEDDTRLRIGDTPSGLWGRWGRLSGVKKALGVILAIWAIMALTAIGRGKRGPKWSGQDKLDGVIFGGLDSYVYTELSYDPDTYITTNTEENGSTRTANASLVLGPNRMLNLILPEGVEGEIIISYAADNTIYDDTQGMMVIETTWPEGENQESEVGIWSDDYSLALAISTKGSHRIHLILPTGFPVPYLSTNVPIRPEPADLDLTYTFLSLLSESQNITGSYNVTGSIEFRTETGDIDVDVRVLDLPPPGRRKHRGVKPSRTPEQEDEPREEEGAWYWPFKASGRGEEEYQVEDRYSSGLFAANQDPDEINHNTVADETDQSPGHRQDEQKTAGGWGEPDDPPHRKHRRPQPDPTSPGEGDGTPGDQSPPPPPPHPTGHPTPPHHPPEFPSPHHPHGPPPSPRDPPGPPRRGPSGPPPPPRPHGPPPSPHHPPGPPHRGPPRPALPHGPPPAHIRAHSMTGSTTLRIHSDSNNTTALEMKKHKGDKHHRLNHTRPVEVEAYTSTGSVSITDKTFFGLFEAGTIEGKLLVKTDTEEGKEIEVVRRKVSEKGGRVEGFVKCSNGTRIAQDEDMVDIEEVIDRPRYGPKEPSRPPHGPPPPPHSPHHPPPPHGPPPPSRGPNRPPHGPPHGPPGPHHPHGPPPPPPGLSRISARTVFGDIRLDL